jgi:hypothetical protein
MYITYDKQPNVPLYTRLVDYLIHVRNSITWPLIRMQCAKKIHQYVKDHNLILPDQRGFFYTDDTLAKIFPKNKKVKVSTYARVYIYVH